MTVTFRRSGGPLAQLRKQLQDIERRRPSARAYSPKGRETHLAILNAARDIFVAEGHAGLSIGKIAERTGVNKGNIAYYYATKTELLEAMLLESLGDYLETHIEQIDQGKRRADGAIADVVRFIFEDLRSNFRFFLQVWGCVASDPKARDIAARIYAIEVDFIAELVRAARKDFTARRARILALEIMAIVEGLGVFHGLALIDARTMRALERNAQLRIEQIVMEA